MARIRPTLDNAERVRAALVQFGFGELDIPTTDLMTPGKVIQLGYEPNRVDLMTSIMGVTFEEAWDTRVAGDLDGIGVFSSGRPRCCENRRGPVTQTIATQVTAAQWPLTRTRLLSGRIATIPRVHLAQVSPRIRKYGPGAKPRWRT